MISKHCNIGAAKHIEKNKRNKLFQTPDTYDREMGREILVNCNDWWCLTYETTLKLHKSQGANEHLFQHMMTSSNGNIFRVTGPLCGEFTGHRWQWRGTLMFSLICVWINGWVNNREAGDLRRYRAHYDVTVMTTHHSVTEICTCVHISPKKWCTVGHLSDMMWDLRYGFNKTRRNLNPAFGFTDGLWTATLENPC